jgi:hypothetical protein
MRNAQLRKPLLPGDQRIVSSHAESDVIETRAPFVKLLTIVGQVLMQDKSRAASWMDAQSPYPLPSGLARDGLEPKHLLVPAKASIVISHRQRHMGPTSDRGHSAHLRGSTHQRLALSLRLADQTRTKERVAVCAGDTTGDLPPPEPLFPDDHAVVVTYLTILNAAVGYI